MNLTIADFQQRHKQAFRDLNYEWIATYFEIEDFDKKMLEDPTGHILDKGGAILIAELDGEPVGTCALIRMEEGVFELAKMAVTPRAQGNQVGYKIGLAVLEKARDLGASTIFLETNSSLKPAISLYHKLGFSETCGKNSAYSRCNIQMEKQL